MSSIEVQKIYVVHWIARNNIANFDNFSFCFRGLLQSLLLFQQPVVLCVAHLVFVDPERLELEVCLPRLDEHREGHQPEPPRREQRHVHRGDVGAGRVTNRYKRSRKLRVVSILSATDGDSLARPPGRRASCWHQRQCPERP